MSISSAFNFASSGLRVTEARADLVASNIANASTAGYTRREGTQVSGGGQSVDLHMVRQIDDRLAAMSRDASAALGKASVGGEVLRGYLSTLGDIADEISPAARMATFQAGLDLLANNPSNPSVQADVLARADMLVRSLNTASNALEDSRTQAGASFESAAGEVNTALSDIADLNARLLGQTAGTSGFSSLMDEMNQRLDALGSQMDFKSRWEANGTLSLFTAGGTELVNGTDAARLSVDPQSGAILANGTDLTPDRPGVRGIMAGRLAGLSQMLSTVIPQMKLQQDELARGLVEGFQAADSSLLVGQPGLFTDAGAAFDPAQRDGLAGRLSINAAVRPNAGGALWRLRDGMSAATPGDAGATAQINAFITAFDTARPIAPDAGLGSSARLGDMAANMVGAQHTIRVSADRAAGTAGIRLAAFEDGRSTVEGVNIDTELQKLLEIEQSYGANSQVLSSLSNMIDTLLNAV